MGFSNQQFKFQNWNEKVLASANLKRQYTGKLNNISPIRLCVAATHTYNSSFF